MRVWLLEDRQTDPASLESALRRLVKPDGGLTLLGSGPFRPGLMADLRSCQLDLLVADAAAWPDGPEGLELGGLDAGLVVATTAERCGRFLALAAAHPVGLV